MVVVIPGYNLRTTSSILSPVQTMILGLALPVSGDAGFESQRTVVAAATRAVSGLSRFAIVASFTFCLAIKAQKRGIAKYAVILALHVV